MIRFLIFTSLLVSLLAHGQNQLEIQFLKDKVFGDTLDLSKFSEKPIELDTTEFFTYINLSMKDGIIDSNLVVISVNQKLLNNNGFMWNQLDSTEFIIQGEPTNEKEFRATNSFSLPIQLDSNTIIIKHGWYYDPSYAGEQIDIWKLTDGQWERVRSYLLWMS